MDEETNINLCHVASSAFPSSLGVQPDPLLILPFFLVGDRELGRIDQLPKRSILIGV